MKGLLPAILILLFPYYVLFLLYCCFRPSMTELLFHHSILRLFLSLLIFWLAALVSAIVICAKSLACRRSALEAARVNMAIKLIHIPAYLMIFVAGLACMLTIFTMGFALILILLDIGTIVLSGIVGISAVGRSRFEHALSTGGLVVHGILQFVFCADVVSAVIVYYKAKRNITQKNSCIQQHLML